MLWSKTNQGEVDDRSWVQLGQPQRPGRQDNMGQRFTGGEGASLWVPGRVVHAVETNVCKDLEGGVLLVLSLTSVYLTSPHSATCTQISCYFAVLEFQWLAFPDCVNVI